MIGDLYNAKNVVVGQAATFFAAKDTALPDLANWNSADPFDPAFFLTHTFDPTGSTTFTLTVTNGQGSDVTSALTTSGLTSAQIQSALEALANVGVGGATVTGASAPFSVVFHGEAEGSALSAQGTGGTVSVTEPLWQPCGATDQGWQFGAAKNTQTITIEEQSTPVGVYLTSQNVSIAGSLSEDITRTLALALNATSAATAASATDPGFDLLELQDTPIEYGVAMVSQNVNGFGRLIYAPRWTQLANAQVSFRRAADKRMYPVQFETVCQTSQIKIYNFTAAKTA